MKRKEIEVTLKNYIEEKGLGDLSIVFTKAKELKHQIRLRNIMNFFFNFENAEQIYEKELRLEQVQKELGELANDYQEYHRSVFRVKKLFQECRIYRCTSGLYRSTEGSESR